MPWLDIGYIGKLKLVIPYANPNTQPWIIKIEDLFLIVEPEYEVSIFVSADFLEKDILPKIVLLEKIPRKKALA